MRRGEGAERRSADYMYWVDVEANAMEDSSFVSSLRSSPPLLTLMRLFRSSQPPQG